MFLILKLFVLVALIKLLLATDKPFLCSGLYAGLVFLFGLMYGPVAALVAGVISFVLSSIYFWLLSKFEGAGLLWWVILIGGLLIGLV
jgi:hypothetical protein